MRSQETRFNIPESRYLRSGQFAALCRTTKETLRHYRAIGLIEPAFVSDSGYAYYSPLQLGDFMLVAALQRAGSSLADIHRYLEDPQASELEAMIAEHINRLEAERRALRAQQRFLQKTLDRSRTLSEWLTVKNGWRIVERPEVRFFEINISDLFSEENPVQGERLVNELVDTGHSLIERGMVGQMQGATASACKRFSTAIPIRTSISALSRHPPAASARGTPSLQGAISSACAAPASTSFWFRKGASSPLTLSWRTRSNAAASCPQATFTSRSSPSTRAISPPSPTPSSASG